MSDAGADGAGRKITWLRVWAAARVHLGLSDEEFWQITIPELRALTNEVIRAFGGERTDAGGSLLVQMRRLRRQMEGSRWRSET